MVEEDGSDVVKMTVEGEETASSLIRPDLNLVIVTARDEERLGLVKVDATNWPIVFLEAIDQSPHSVVPELNSG